MQAHGADCAALLLGTHEHSCCTMATAMLRQDDGSAKEELGGAWHARAHSRSKQAHHTAATPAHRPVWCVAEQKEGVDPKISVAAPTCTCRPSSASLHTHTNDAATAAWDAVRRAPA